MIAPDLAVTVGAVRLPNPILCASGTFGYGTEHPEATASLGGVVTKTITLEPRAGNRPPRIVETPSGMLNSIGLQNVGVDRFIGEKLPDLRAVARAIIVSVGGRAIEEFVEVVARLDREEGIDAYELNISCPNVREGGLEFCQNPQAAAEVIRTVRASTSRPIWAKLSPNVTSIGQLARACEEAGADAITAINTFVGMAVDLEGRCARLPSTTGGLSGPAIRPMALARVYQVVKNVSIPVVAVGGIVSGRDALEFLLVGANAVQVGTSHFLRPDQGSQVLEEMRSFLEAQRIDHLGAFIGTIDEVKE